MSSKSRLFQRNQMTLGEKLQEINVPFLFLIFLTACVGFAMLYSAAQGFHPWAFRQMIRFFFGVGVLILIALIDIRFWLRWSYWFYLLTLAALIVVAVKGTIGMGAQRWIDLGFMRLQPSEIMKIALVLALSRYFHMRSFEEIRSIAPLIPPLLITFVPVGLVMMQPDLGTALLLLMEAAVLFFVSGVRLWKFGAIIVAGLGSLPILWSSLHAYQKKRVLTFLDPESDPLGSGYHILQSKIAIGSGGLFGKGFMQGTQGHLNFLPERQTDFIFTMLAEEFGLFGGVSIVLLYSFIFIYAYYITLQSRSHFGHYVGVGVTTTFFLYVFINISMVMGLIPVVGVPLPLISYGGSALMAMMIGFGFLMNIYIHRDIRFGRNEIYG